MLEYLIAYYSTIITVDAIAFLVIIWVGGILGGISNSQRLERTTLTGYQIGATIHGGINLVLFILAFYFTYDAGMTWYDILYYIWVFFAFIVIDVIIFFSIKKEIDQLMSLLPNIY